MTKIVQVGIPRSQKGAANGVAELDGTGKLPSSQLPTSVREWKGNWNADTNTPTLASGVGTNGDTYRVSVSGNTNLDGIDDWEEGDELTFNGDSNEWEKIPFTENSDRVTNNSGVPGATVTDALNDLDSSKAESSHTHTESEITDLDKYTQAQVDSLLSGKEDAFSKNSAFNKAFGTAANTVCEGDDSRLSDARPPTSHTHPLSEITDSGALAAKDTVSEADIDSNSISAAKIQSNAVQTAKIQADAVTNAKLANMATSTVKARVSGGTGNPEDVSIDTLKASFNAPRVSTNASLATLTVNAGTTDMAILTAQAASLTVAAPTGTLSQGQKLIFRIKDNGTARSITWNAIFRVIGVTLPTTTVISKTLYVGCIYNSTDNNWDVVAVNEEA